MSSNPYPFYDDGWNRLLVVLAAGNVIALLLWLTLGERVSPARLSDPAWVPGTFGVVLFFFYVACMVGTLVLWVSMWMYWARAGRPLPWLFLLLFGAWGTAIAFLFLVYRKDLEAFYSEEGHGDDHLAGADGDDHPAGVEDPSRDDGSENSDEFGRDDQVHSGGTETNQ